MRGDGLRNGLRIRIANCKCKQYGSVSKEFLVNRPVASVVGTSKAIGEA